MMVSKYDFAKKLAKIKKLNINYIAPFKSVQKIHKTLGTILSVKKIKRRIKINVPKIEDFLKEFDMDKINEKYSKNIFNFSRDISNL